MGAEPREAERALMLVGPRDGELGGIWREGNGLWGNVERNGDGIELALARGGVQVERTVVAEPH